MNHETEDTAHLVRASITRSADELKKLSEKIHRNPELAFHERKACAWQTALLRKWGFTVRSPFAGLETAYKAMRGKGRPVFCYIAEYDALPDIGHACGHNLICTTALGAARALADVLKAKNIPGTVAVLGTPAEESKGGKLIMIANGALQGLDAVMEAHPSARTVPDTGSTAIRRVKVTYHGTSAHAAGAPEAGRNALDAVMLLFAGINAWRQHLRESDRVHGIVNEGGVAPNIIPARASCTFFLRSLHDDRLAQMIRRFKAVAHGAALMTATKLEISPGTRGYKARRPNAALNTAFMEAATRAGLAPEIPTQSGRGSSDFGDVSHLLPGVHVYFGISKKIIPGHSDAFREAAGAPYAQAQMLRAAEALAAVGCRYMTDAAFRKKVADHLKKRAD